MKLRDFLPPVIGRVAGAVARSFGEVPVADFIRGRDVDASYGAASNRLHEPYAQSAWVNSAVSHVADEIGGRPLKFYQGAQEYQDSAIAAWWQRPALGPKTHGVQTRLSIGAVLHDLAAWERLEGEWFICLDEAWLITAGRNAARGTALPPFLIAHPGRMQAIVQGGTLMGWRYVEPGGRQFVFLPEQVKHHKAFNPYDDWRGLGKLQAARMSAERSFLTGAYIRDLARNNGDQGMVVIAKNGVVTDVQREQLTADLRAKRLALARGEARDIILGGEITIDRPKEQAASAELLASDGLSHEETFIAFGVPPSMTAVKAAYSIGKDSDYYQLIARTCQPLGGSEAASLAEVASLQTGLSLIGKLDWEDHPVMIEVRNSRIESGLRLWATGMPMQDISAYLGLGMKPYAGWDVGYLPFSIAPAASLNEPAENPTEDPALAEDAEKAIDPDAARLRLLVLARSRQCTRVVKASDGSDQFAMFVCTCHGGSMIAMKDRDPRELAQWRTLMTKRRATVKSFESAFGRVLMAARQETLRKIDQQHRAVADRVTRSAFEPQQVKAAAADLLFSLAEFTDSFTATMRDREKAALNTAGKQLFDEVGKDDPFAYPPEAVLEYLRGRENKLKDTPREIHEEIKAAIEEGLTAGDTTDELTARVREAFNGVSSERARRIAMTETAAAYGPGRQEAMKQAGVPGKAWLTSGNANVRAAHAAAGKEYGPDNAIAIDEPFIVGGEELQFPGDESGSPENVVNCHCVSVARALSGDEKSLDEIGRRMLLKIYAEEATEKAASKTKS